MKSQEELHSLPPLARAEAMDQPYRPGRTSLLVGLLVIVAIYALVAGWYVFLRKPQKVTMRPPPTPGIVYQNLRTPIATPRPEADSATPESR